MTNTNTEFVVDNEFLRNLYELVGNTPEGEYVFQIQHKAIEYPSGVDSEKLTLVTIDMEYTVDITGLSRIDVVHKVFEEGRKIGTGSY